MDNSEEARRLREAFAATSPEDVATAGCPPAERIWEAVKNELDAARLRQILHHVASCPVCTESWRLASEIESPTETSGRIDKRRSPSWFRLTSAAAAVFAVVAIGVVLKERLPTSIDRSGTVEELALIAEGSPLTRDECRPRWVPVEGATYDVQVLTEGFELLNETTGLTNPEFAVPEPLLKRLPTEAALLLRIEARLPREVTKSKTLRLPC